MGGGEFFGVPRSSVFQELLVFFSRFSEGSVTYETRQQEKC